MIELGHTDTETLVIVRETLNEDNEPVRDPFATRRAELEGCKVVARMPSPDVYTTGQRTVTTLDVRHPDADADIRSTDLVMRPGEPADQRPRWTVEGEPARSPFPGGGCLFVLQREAG